MNCRNCDNLQTDYPIKVIDKPSLYCLDDEEYHFEDGFKCTWNGISSNKIEDLQKGTCRCKQ